MLRWFARNATPLTIAMMGLAAILLVFELAVHAMSVRTSHDPTLVAEQTRITLFAKGLNVLPLLLWTLTAALAIANEVLADPKRAAFRRWSGRAMTLLSLAVTLLLAAAPFAFSSAPDVFVERFTTPKARLSMSRSNAALDGIRRNDSVEINTISSRVLTDDAPASRVFSMVFPMTLFGASEVEQEIEARISDILSTPHVNDVIAGINQTTSSYIKGRSDIQSTFADYRSRSASHARSITIEQLRADAREHWSRAYAAVRSGRSSASLSNPVERASHRAISAGQHYNDAFASLRPIMEQQAMARWKQSSYGNIDPSLSSTQFYTTPIARSLMKKAMGPNFDEAFMRYRQLTRNEILAVLSARATSESLDNLACFQDAALHAPGARCYDFGVASARSVIAPLMVMAFSLVWVLIAASELIGELIGSLLGKQTIWLAVAVFTFLVVGAPLAVGQFSNYSAIQIAVLDQLTDDIPVWMFAAIDWVMRVEPALEFAGLWLYDHAGIGAVIETMTP